MDADFYSQWLRTPASFCIHNKGGIMLQKRNWLNALQIVIFTVMLAAEFVLVECYEHNPFVEVRSEAFFFNILLVELIGYLLFFLFGRLKIALWIVSPLIMIFGLVNHYVMEFRSTPFVPWDFFSIGTAASVVGDYTFTIPGRVWLVTLGFVLIMIMAAFLPLHLKKPLAVRIVGTALFVACLVSFSSSLQDENFQTKHYLYPFLFTPAYMTKVNGMLVTFTMNLAYIAIDKPKGYHREMVEETLNAYVSDENRDGASEVDVKPEDYPNIIVIMDEAFSDLSVLGDFMTNGDYMPFFHSMEKGAENTITGTLNVSVCGGNTANTEFEFLTGNTMAFLPNGSIPYQQYIKQDTESLASYLGSLGYATYSYHPYYASGWNRDEVYPRLGFEQCYFLEDMTSKQVLRGYVSDESDFNYVKKLYETKDPSKPMFLFNVTMQNHGSYNDAYDNFTPDIKVVGSEKFPLQQYLSLVKQTDSDLQDLLEYFKKQKEKTVVVFFGDHQPNDYLVNQMLETKGLSCSDLGKDNQYLRFQVPYMIWANYDIEEATEVETSANYLGAEVLKAVGVKTSPYMNYLLDFKEKYPVLSSVRAGGEDREALLTYQQIQYYQIFDKE